MTITASLALVAAPLAACSADWTAETVLDAGTKLGGCAAGDLLPEHPGDELVTVAGDGTCWLAWREDGTWKSAVIAKTAGEMIGCAVGDPDPTRPGLEVVICGMQTGTEDDGGAGEAHLVYRDGDTWKSESLFVDDALVHGVAVGDVDPAQGGDEVVLVGFSLRATLVSRAKGTWATEVVAELPGPGKNAVAWAGGVAIACSDGTLVHATRAGEEWAARAVDRADAGQARLGARGGALLAARDDGALVHFAGPDAEPAVVHREGAKLRGAVIADLDPSAPGLELATAGYEQRATVLVRAGDGWEAHTVFEDTGRFHHACAADVADRGTVLVVCGYSGRLTAVRRAAVD